MALLPLIIESFIVAKEADGRALRTLQDYRRVLVPFSDWCHDRGADIHDLDRETVRQYVVTLRRNDWAQATVAIHIRNLRTFLHWCHLERMTEDNLAQAIATPRTARREELPLTLDEIKRLLLACSGDDLAARDKALILSFIDTGLRLGEMAEAKRDNLHFGDNGRSWIRIYAPKTRAWRFAILGQRTTGALTRYLAGRRDTHPELWIGRRGPLAREGMYRAIKHRAAKAGLGKRVHPHLFRKTFATHWLDNNGDPERLRVLAGWTPQTLAQMLEIYVASRWDHLERAHAQAGPVDNLNL